MSAIKDLAVGRQDIFKLPPDSIQMDSKWNARVHNDELDAHIEELANSIAEVGVKQPLTVFMKDGEPFLTDGFCRMKAVKLAIKKGAEIEAVPCRLEERHSNEADHVLSMIVRNSGKPLATIEQAEVVKRLLAFEWSIEKIKASTGYSGAHLSTLQALMAAPVAIQNHIKKGNISVNLALDTMKGAGSDEKAVERVEKAVKGAKEIGKRKATKRTANRNNGGNPKRVNWPKHGPKLAEFLDALHVAYDGLDEAPEALADIIVEAKGYLNEKVNGEG